MRARIQSIHLQKTMYLEKMKLQMRQSNAKLEIFKARIAKEPQKIKNIYVYQMREWEKKGEVLETKINEMRRATGKSSLAAVSSSRSESSRSYNAMKADIDSDWHDIEILITTIEENNNNVKFE